MAKRWHVEVYYKGCLVPVKEFDVEEVKELQEPVEDINWFDLDRMEIRYQKSAYPVLDAENGEGNVFRNEN
jgi:hypothetical protein